MKEPQIVIKNATGVSEDTDILVDGRKLECVSKVDITLEAGEFVSARLQVELLAFDFALTDFSVSAALDYGTTMRLSALTPSLLRSLADEISGMATELEDRVEHQGER